MEYNTVVSIKVLEELRRARDALGRRKDQSHVLQNRRLGHKKDVEQAKVQKVVPEKAWLGM